MSRKQKMCDVAKNEHVTDKRWLDGPHFETTGLRDGDEWSGQHAFYFVRCIDCDTAIETVFQSNDTYPGAHWNSQHKTFVYPNGGTPQRKVA